LILDKEIGRGALRRAALEGDVDDGSVMAGQIVGLIKKERGVKEIIEDIIKNSEKLLLELYNKYI
jgi:enoyl-[acyl-carrier protein] reductase II